MRRIVASLTVLLTAPGVAAAQDRAGFGASEHIPGPALSATAAATGPDGTMLVAGTTRGTGREGGRIIAARRAPGGAWRSIELPHGRDPQAAVAADGSIAVAWSDPATGRVGLAVAAPDGRPVRRTLPGTSPRLATPAGGEVVLAFRRGRELRVAGVTGPSRLLSRAAAGLAVAAAGDRVMVAWSAPYPGRGKPRRLRTVPLDRNGRPAGRTTLVSHDAGATVRLAGGATGRTIVTWLRPPDEDRPAAAFTRTMTPVARPARPVAVPGARTAGAPGVAIDAADRAVLAVQAFAEGDAAGYVTGFARSRFGGVWTGARRTGAPAPVASSPQAGLPPGEQGYAVWSVARAAPGEPVHDLVVARHGADPVALGTVGSASGRGASLGTAGGRAVAAWPHPAGGFAVASRS